MMGISPVSPRGRLGIGDKLNSDITIMCPEFGHRGNQVQYDRDGRHMVDDCVRTHQAISEGASRR